MSPNSGKRPASNRSPPRHPTMRTNPDMKAPDRRAGFTLVEILIAVSIVVILGAVVGINVLGAPQQARVSSAKAQLDAFKTALGLYALMADSSLVGLHSLLVGRIRELVCAKALDERGAGATLASELGKADWQVKNHIRWSRAFSRDELSQALRDAAALERVLKGSGDSDAAFVRFIASICS